MKLSVVSSAFSSQIKILFAILVQARCLVGKTLEIKTQEEKLTQLLKSKYGVITFKV